MDEQVLETLEFHKMLEQIVPFAATHLGREKIKALKPVNELRQVEMMLAETKEGWEVLRFRDVPLRDLRDIRPFLKRANLGSVLAADELLDIVETVTSGRRLKRFLSALLEKEKLALPRIKALAERMAELVGLDRGIRAVVNEHGEIVDDASPELKKVRTSIRQTEMAVRQKLEHMLRSSHYQKMLQEPIVTLRRGHYVLPVKQEYRSRFGGIVHDESASGATVFIEPEAVIQLNRQLEALHGKEEREIERLLKCLSARVAEHAEALVNNVEALKALDFIFAKAHYARHLGATPPKLNDDGIIQLKQARHPLISRETVVPVDIRLGEDYTVLVITGPNTGGKTVALKTVGLITLMAMAGLFIPAADGSTVAVFDRVFADIGDEQSIEQNLSTFSGHMKNIVRILERVSANSLVLFDELGSGTDPTEGAALAMAILDAIYKRGSRAVATTHYSELKAYAYDRENVMNASVDFDINTLKPTYQLRIGVPGRSHAFLIAERLGLPKAIVERAKMRMTVDEQRVDDMIASLEENRVALEKDRQAIHRLKQEAARVKEQLEREREKLEREKERLKEQAEREARQIVRQAKREAEAIIQQLRNMKQGAETVKAHELIALKTQLNRLEREPSRGNDQKPLRGAAVKTQDVKPGDDVYVHALKQKGRVLAKLSSGEVRVQLGIMKMNVPLTDVVPVQAAEREELPQPSVALKRGQPDVGTALDLRGQTSDEALKEADKYLDDALLAGFHRVTLIHGKGTGALRKAIHQFLSNHRAVKSYRLGREGEGGSGVTVVDLA